MQARREQWCKENPGKCRELKARAEQRREVVYHMIDVASPADFFSAGRWAREAREAVDDIRRRGRLPIVCGGSGFYLEALLEGLPPGGFVDADLRSALTEWAKGRPEAVKRHSLHCSLACANQTPACCW